MGQDRRLTNLGLRANVSYVKGIHNLKAGVTFSDTILSEQDSIGIVDPTFNAVCLNSDGSNVLNPRLTNPVQCAGALQQTCDCCESRVLFWRGLRAVVSVRFQDCD